MVKLLAQSVLGQIHSRIHTYFLMFFFQLSSSPTGSSPVLKKALPEA